MAAEKKEVKVETCTSKSLRAAFKRHCRKMGVSVSQRLRDLIQQEVKRKK